MSVTVKVFYERSNRQNEIRRFAVKTSPGSDSFAAIRDKVKELYTFLSHGNFQLFWQDSDGDRIAFSSGDELKEALEYVTDGVLRVYIPESKEHLNGQASQESGEPGNLKKPQQTFDQGPKDEKQQNHQESQSTESGNQSESQQSNNEPLHPNVACDGCQGSVVGIRFKCCVCEDYDLCSSCEAKGIHNEHDMYKIKQPRFDPFACLPPHLGRHLHRYMNKPAGAGAHAHAHAHAQSSFQTAASEDYLNKMGANIAAFLDPFGIDVTFDVHDNGESRSGGWSHGCGSGRGRGGSCGSKQGGASAWGFCPAWDEMEKRYASEKKATTAESNVDKDSNMKSAKPNPSQDVPMEQDGKKESPMQGNRNDGPEEWTFVSDQDGHATANPNTAIPMPAPAMKPSAPSQGTAPGVATGQTEIDGSHANIYPNLRIQQSLDQMLAMGFTNTGNWLSDLLTEHDGDIGATLDAVKTKATQQLDSFRGSQ